jgi:hypothetical protein
MGRKNKNAKDENFGRLLGGAKSREDAKTAVDRNTFKILEAKIKDDFCHYAFEVTEGAGLGDPHGVKGTNLIKDELRETFARLRVHLAVIDDVFNYQKIEIKDIDQMHGHEVTQLFHVTGFKIKGTDDAETVILIGNKYLSGGSRMELESPAIALDSLSSYKWYNELKAAIDAARYEVALYKEGNYTPVKVEEDEEEDDPKVKQMKMEMPSTKTNGVPAGSFDEDFENE